MFHPRTALSVAFLQRTSFRPLSPIRAFGTSNVLPRNCDGPLQPHQTFQTPFALKQIHLARHSVIGSTFFQIRYLSAEKSPSPENSTSSESSLIHNQIEIKNNQEKDQSNNPQRPRKKWEGSKQEKNMRIVQSVPWKIFSFVYYFGLICMFGYMGAFFYHFLVSGKYSSKSKRILQICAKVKKLCQNPNLEIDAIIPEIELMASHLVYNNEVAPLKVLESEILKEPGFRKLADSTEVEHRRLFSLILTIICQAGNKGAQGFLEQNGLELLEHSLHDSDQIVEFHTLDSLFHLIDSSEHEQVTKRLRATSVNQLQSCLTHWSPLTVAASRLILDKINGREDRNAVALQSICKAFGFNTQLAVQEINIEIADSVPSSDPFVTTAIALWYIMHNRKSSHCYDLLYSAIQKDPANKFTQFTLGLYWFRRAYFSESILWLEKVVSQDPQYWPVLCLLYNAKQWLLGYYWSPVHEWFDKVNSVLHSRRSTLDEKAHDIGTFQNFLYMWSQPSELPPEEADKEKRAEQENKAIHRQLSATVGRRA